MNVNSGQNISLKKYYCSDFLIFKAKPVLLLIKVFRSFLYKIGSKLLYFLPIYKSRKLKTE